MPKCALPITFWPLTASIAMEVRNNLPMSQHKIFLEQIHWIELFYGMSDVWFGRDAVYSKIRLPVKILMRWAKVNCFSDQNLFDNATRILLNFYSEFRLKKQMTLPLTSEETWHLGSQKISGPTNFLIIADDIAQWQSKFGFFYKIDWFT